jgi:hypothetical protein
MWTLKFKDAAGKWTVVGTAYASEAAAADAARAHLPADPARIQVRPTKLTQAVAFQQIRSLGLSVRKTDAGEFRVSRGDEASAYYADDLQDAVDTARAMASDKR